MCWGPIAPFSLREESLANKNPKTICIARVIVTPRCVTDNPLCPPLSGNGDLMPKKAH